MTMNGFTPIAGPYSYALHRVGLSLSNGAKTVYFQPGDGAAETLASIEALDEIGDDALAAGLAHIAFGDYFAN